MKQTLLDLFQQSIIMQGLISLLIIGFWGYMVVTGQEVNDTLSALVTLVVGFFFGSKLALVKARNGGS